MLLYLSSISNVWREGDKGPLNLRKYFLSQLKVCCFVRYCVSCDTFVTIPGQTDKRTPTGLDLRDLRTPGERIKNQGLSEEAEGEVLFSKR